MIGYIELLIKPVTPALFTQFRKLYSSSSLTTELVIVQDGQFVVRATAMVDARVLATAMAAHGQLEVAEDAAMSRLGTFLGLHITASESTEPEVPASVPQAFTDNLPTVTQVIDPIGTAPSPPEPSSATPKTIPLKAIPKAIPTTILSTADQATSSTPTATSDLKKTVKAVTTPPKRVPNSNKVVSIAKARPETEPDIEINLDPIPALDIVAPEEEERPIGDIPDEPSELLNPEPLEANSQDLATKPEITHPEKSIPHGATANAATASETAVPVAMPASTVAANALKDFDNSSSPVDLSDIIAQTDVEMGRLGWTSSQGRKYLEETYHKRSRQQLNDEELLEFLLYLESQPTPMV